MTTGTVERGTNEEILASTVGKDRMVAAHRGFADEAIMRAVDKLEELRVSVGDDVFQLALSHHLADVRDRAVLEGDDDSKVELDFYRWVLGREVEE